GRAPGLRGKSPCRAGLPRRRPVSSRPCPWPLALASPATELSHMVIGGSREKVASGGHTQLPVTFADNLFGSRLKEVPMADDLDKIPEELLTEEERKKRAKKLTQDIANRYNPDRLSRVVVEGAGQGEHLDEGTRSEMESRIGGSFSHVRVFRGPFAEA